MAQSLQALSKQDHLDAWAARIMDCGNSGMPVRSWCQEYGLGETMDTNKFEVRFNYGPNTKVVYFNAMDTAERFYQKVIRFTMNRPNPLSGTVALFGSLWCVKYDTFYRIPFAIPGEIAGYCAVALLVVQ